MKERKKEFPKAWLSEQQKEILKIVCSTETKEKKRDITNARKLSWDIARKFDNRIEMGKKGKEILSKKHTASMSRSLKRLRERDLITDFGTKTHYGATEQGFNWCELNVDGFKEKRERKSI
jgi:hypothetical protein